MNVLILGVTGMLGHKLWQVLREREPAWRIFGTARRLPHHAAALYRDAPEQVLEGVDGTDIDTVVHALSVARPAVVVNCIGIIKQAAAAKHAVPSIAVNALFPHRAAALSRACGARFIHISTDCVFSGHRGGYREDDVADAMDLYGRSKHLGEVAGEGALTLRTSIIGRELTGASGLIEWFLSNRSGYGGTARAQGYQRAVFSGLTTLELSRLIARIIERHENLHGLWHVSAEPIDKHSLLLAAGEAYSAGIDLERSDRLVIDRSLDSTRFREATGWTAPPWDAMIRDMAADETPYDDWRTS